MVCRFLIDFSVFIHKRLLLCAHARHHDVCNGSPVDANICDIFFKRICDPSTNSSMTSLTVLIRSINPTPWPQVNRPSSSPPQSEEMISPTICFLDNPCEIRSSNKGV